MSDDRLRDALSLVRTVLTDEKDDKVDRARLVCDTALAVDSVVLYRCPTHGLIESPTWHEDEIPEDSGFYCPINLTGTAEASHTGITDEVCGKDVSGPFKVRIG